jgi:iron complex outermembrane receptor protein
MPLQEERLREGDRLDPTSPETGLARQVETLRGRGAPVVVPTFPATFPLLYRLCSLRGRWLRGKIMHFKSVISAIAFALAAQAFAQDDAVVVTATRFPEKKLEHPIGVTVVTREQIADSGAANLPELLSRYAGINTRNNTGSPDVAIDMRGFGASGDQNTLVLLDGQRLNDIELTTVRWSAIPLAAIERVEIQRGGGAVMYGSGATGGTINIITRSPIAGDKSAMVSTSYGSYNANDLRGTVNVAGTNTGLSLTANQHNSDNYRANNRLEQGNVLGDLRWTGDRAGLVFKFGLDNQSLRLPGARTNVQLQADPRGATTPGDYSSRDAKNAALSGRFEFDRFDLAADLSYRDTKRDAFFDNYFGIFGQTSFVDTQGRVWAFNPRVKLPFQLLGKANSLVVGMDVDYWDYLSVRSTDIATQNTPVANIAATQRDRAFYAQNHTALTDATKLTLGVRTQHVDVDSNDRANPLPIAHASQSRNPRSWEAALRHKLTSVVSLYGKIGASFRVATLDEMFNNCGLFTSACVSTITPLEPQISRDREVGFEYKQQRVRLQASYYRMDLRNEIHFNALTFLNMNLSQTQRQGLELEGSWNLGSSWSFFGSYTHARATFREGAYGGVDVSGKNVPLVPRDQAKLGVAWAVADKTRVSGALGYVGKQYFDNDQANDFAGGQMPSYVTADLKLGHVIGPWSFTLAGNNLTDRKYYTYAVRGGAVAATNFNAYPMAGRTFLLTAAYRFQ